MKHIALILALCLPMAACAQTEVAATGTITQVAPETMLAAKKSLIAAHGLHEAAADALTAAANANVCKGQCAVQAKQYLLLSAEALKSADALVALGDAPGIETKISGAVGLISQIQALIGRH